MRRIRVSTLGLAALALWALPATATPRHTSTTTITITAGKPSEFEYALSAKTTKHGTVTLVVTNSGTVAHNLRILGKTTPQLAPGQTAKLTVTFPKPGSYTYFCTLSGHAAAGMKGALKVT